MKLRALPIRGGCDLAATFGLLALMMLAKPAQAQISNLSVRAMAANITSGNFQSYETPGINIFKGLKPDIVAIQEFRAFTGSSGSTNTADIRALVDTAFGTNFHYFKETAPGYSIPNGIVSRWPIINAGSWNDVVVPDRGFAWAQIDLPGTNDLYVVSLHLYSSGSASDRNSEALAVKSNILANFPPNAWILVGGDFNTSSRSEAAVTTFKTFLSDSPIPTDNAGDPDTNAGRSSPYDYLLPSFSLTNYHAPVVLPSNTFSNGLVFDSRVYTPLADVPPVVFGDSGAFQMQHMAVVKNFQLPVYTTNSATPPSIVLQPQSQTNNVGTPVEFTVAASGSTPLVYQWRLNGTHLAGANATNYFIGSVQSSNAGNYSVVVTNSAGNITSAVATLTVVTPPTNTPPQITSQPVSVTNVVGSTASFSVAATGTAPLAYQWQFNSTNILAATNSSYARANVQTNDAGSYSVVVTNVAGAVTSAIASLTVTGAPPAMGATNLVISQFYGGGGNSGATFRNDFVELFNPGASPASLNGWTLQYASATGSSWSQSALSGTIQPYSYYLLMLSSNGTSTVGAALPAADATNTGMNISATAGKLALVNTNVFLTGTNPVGNSTIVDFAGYGSTATAYEGTGPVGTVSGNTNSLLRLNGGYTDTNNNTNDFTVLSPPAPRNTGSPANLPPAPPAIAPTLGVPLLVGDQFICQITGTTASNYIVQATTNLAAPNWLNLQTNAAPFWFTNPANQPQQFYRGAVAP